MTPISNGADFEALQEDAARWRELRPHLTVRREEPPNSTEDRFTLCLEPCEMWCQRATDGSGPSVEEIIDAVRFSVNITEPSVSSE